MYDAPPADPAPVLEVRGDTRCPRAAEVSEALGRVLGPSASSDVAELREEAGALVVVVRRASGEVVGVKRVPASLACSVRAEVAAVSIAALEGQLPGGDAGPLAVPPPPEPAAPRSPAPAAALTRASDVVAPRAEEPLAFEVGVAALASLSGTHLAPAGRLDIALGRASSAWSLSLAALVVGRHTVVVAPGEGVWWRVGAEAAVTRDFALWHGGRLAVRVGAAVTAVDVSGRSFPRNRADMLLDPGAVAGLRLVPFAGRVRPWIDLGAAYWPTSHALSVSSQGGGDAVDRAELPKAELFLGVGGSFGGLR